ncbi:MAG: methionine--tRNA ligase subunit beta [Candidatus Paceibacterota bacterium]
MKDIISYEDFIKLDLRIGTIIKGEPVPKSDKLLRLEVDLGESTQQIVAGLGKTYLVSDLINKQVLVIANLAPRSLMGYDSQGMILAVTESDQPLIICPEKTVTAGQEVK